MEMLCEEGEAMNVIAFDTETTGFNCALSGGKDEVLQLAIVDEDGRALFNEMFCPAEPAGAAM
jgi:DNA polymerase III epsilon subunit-like protein